MGKSRGRNSEIGKFEDRYLRDLPVKAAILDEELNILYMNKRLEDRVGKDALGEKCYLAYTDDPKKCENCPLIESIPLNESRSIVCEGALGGKIVKFRHKAIEVGKKRVILEVMEDITPQIAAERQFQQAHRALRLLSQCNQILVRAEDESELLEEICEAIVNVGGYCLTWVGFAEDKDEKIVRPVAQRGFEDGYLENIKITWDDTKEGRGPTGTAIRKAEPSIARNILTDPNFEPWREEAVKRGYASSIALPLIDDNEVLGALNIYSSQSDAFASDEEDLLMELADDLAYGLKAIRTRKERKKAIRKLRKLSHRLVDIQETERKRISRELHDELGQALTAISVDLALIKKKLPLDDFPTVNTRIRELEDLVDQTDEQVRDFASNLRPPMLDDMDLIAALKFYLGKCEKKYGVNVQFEAHLDGRFNQNLEITLFRAVQESLTNAVRHGKADKILVDLRGKTDYIKLEIEDNGKGFDVQEVQNNKGEEKGIGLMGMRERINLLDGDFQVQSSPGKGTRISVAIPISEGRKID